MRALSLVVMLCMLCACDSWLHSTQQEFYTTMITNDGEEVTVHMFTVTHGKYHSSQFQDHLGKNVKKIVRNQVNTLQSSCDHQWITLNLPDSKVEHGNEWASYNLITYNVQPKYGC